MRLRQEPTKIGIFVLSLAVIVMASSATAGTVFIGDLGEGAPSVTASGGASISGSCSVSGLLEGCSFSITAPVGAASFLLDFQAVNVFEPGSIVVSDLLQRTDFSGANTFWVFSSDVNNGPALIPFPITAGVNSLDEDGNPQTVAVITYLNVAGGIVGTDIIQIQSDVPEPSSGLLALLGSAALGVVMLRRRIASRAA